MNLSAKQLAMVADIAFALSAIMHPEELEGNILTQSKTAQNAIANMPKPSVTIVNRLLYTQDEQNDFITQLQQQAGKQLTDSYNRNPEFFKTTCNNIPQKR